MIADQLKNYTQTDHQRLEKLLVSKMKDIRSDEDYVRILQLFYSYFGALEDQINKYINSTKLPDYSARRKTDAIANDIAAMGGMTLEKAAGNALPSISNDVQAFGALYVIEGSTLGGTFIGKMIARQLNLDEHQEGFSFFNGYGDQTNAMWAEFKDILNKQAGNTQDEIAMCEAANDTFIKFKNWIAYNG